MGAATKFLEKLNTEKRTAELVSNMKPPLIQNTQMQPKESFIIPNHSGRHDAGKTGTPTDDLDIANKKYVDDTIAGAIAGVGGDDVKVAVDAAATAGYLGAAFNDGVLRTGTGLSYADGGDFVTLTTNDSQIVHDNLSGFVANEHIDWTIDQGATNIHSGNYINTTYTAGTGLTLTDTTFSCNITQYTNADAVSAVATADDYLKNDASDTTTGTITAAGFTSASGNLTLTSGNLTDGTNSLTIANAKTAYTHSQDNTQAHSDYLLNNASDTTSGTITAGGFTTTGTTSLGTTTVGDHGTASTDEVINVCYGTSDPPTASTTTEGTLFIKYTA